MNTYHGIPPNPESLSATKLSGVLSCSVSGALVMLEETGIPFFYA